MAFKHFLQANRPFFAPPQWLGPATCPLCILHGVSKFCRVLSSSLPVERLVTSDCRSSCRMVETGAAPRRVLASSALNPYQLLSVRPGGLQRWHHMKSIDKASKAKCVDLCRGLFVVILCPFRSCYVSIFKWYKIQLICNK